MSAPRQTPQRAAGGGFPAVTIIIPLFQEVRLIARKLANLDALTYPNRRVIVVDGGSTDGTLGIARRFASRILVNPWPGYRAQKQAALDASRGEWVLNVDADERVTPELAASIRATIESTNGTANGYFIRFLATWCGKRVRFGEWGGQAASASVPPRRRPPGGTRADRRRGA